MNNQRLWVRIDNRLVHGQVVETWLPYSNAKVLIVANDELAEDELRQEVLRLAVPKGVRILFLAVHNVPSFLNNPGPKLNASDVFVLFSSCEDVKVAYLNGLSFSCLNVGNIHYSQGKCQICDHIALNQEEMACLRYLREQGIKLDFRCLPNTQVTAKINL